MTVARTLEVIRPPVSQSGPIGWVRTNLMSNWYNSLLTVVTLALVIFFLKTGLTWVFIDADWSPVRSNLKLFLVGQYPAAEMWRVGVIALMVSLLLGVSWGVWGEVARTFARVAAIGLLALAFFPLSLDDLSVEGRLWILANPGMIGIGYLLARAPSIGPLPMLRPGPVVIAWLVSFFLGIILLRGIEGIPALPEVSTTLWGGLALNLILAIVGIVASFPLGVLLALGRRSNLPAVSYLSILFIETVRGVPLVTLLFMTQIILPLFLPEDFRIDRVSRALLAITLFSSAYMAENVRGGLQAIPQGQVDAAKALGLGGLHTTLFIVLPQALRAVIPAIVGQFISLFKDTSLVVIVGLLDVVGVGKSIFLGNVEWIDSQREVYVFLAAVFWVFTYSMSYASQKLEQALGVGKR
ncbi:MAG: amino acid ABC transporter permease [SAR202 cluster bacterium]|nr:amino acid ABC transporter permease [SAR202 cluster bacterium]